MQIQTGPFQIQTFLSGLQMVFDKKVAICPISNGSASGFPIKIQTICNASQSVFDHLKSGIVRISDPHSTLFKTVDLGAVH